MRPTSVTSKSTELIRMSGFRMFLSATNACVLLREATLPSVYRLKLRIIKQTHTHTHTHARARGGWYYELQWKNEVTGLEPMVDESSIGSSFNEIFPPAC